MISTPNIPPILGLFQKRLEGDDALLELANMRFSSTGLKAELYGDSPDSLNDLLKFRPEPFGFSILHLPRGLNIIRTEERRRVVDLISGFSQKFSGFVLHDHGGMSDNWSEYSEAVNKISESISDEVMLFIEYAAGLDIDSFLRVLERLKELKNVSCCIDIGHVALREINSRYSERSPGKKIFSLKRRMEGPESFMPEVEKAISFGLPAVLKIIAGAGTLKKHVHFHLHDGHPLSTISSYGLSDHLSFFEKVPVPYKYRKRHFLDPIFGATGLKKIIETAMEEIGAGNLSFTVEVHATEKRKKLDDVGTIFSHWRDLTNAERMNYWLWDLSRIHDLVRNIVIEFQER